MDNKKGGLDSLSRIKYEFLKRELKLTDTDVGKMFGYKNAPSFYYATRKSQIIMGVLAIVEKLDPSFFEGFGE